MSRPNMLGHIPLARAVCFISRETVETIETIEPIEPRNNQFKTIHANSLCLLYVSNSLRWDVLETLETLETLEPIETTLKRFSETIETFETRNQQFTTIHMKALHLLYVSNSLQLDVRETRETIETPEPRWKNEPANRVKRLKRETNSS